MPDGLRQGSETETGVVRETVGDDAIVELRLGASCESCGARMLCVPDGSGNRSLRVANPRKARKGDVVSIEETSGFLLKLSAIQFGIPMIMFLAGIFLVYFLYPAVFDLPREINAFLGGLAGLTIAAVISHRIAGHMAETRNAPFSITGIIRRA